MTERHAFIGTAGWSFWNERYHADLGIKTHVDYGCQMQGACCIDAMRASQHVACAIGMPGGHHSLLLVL